MTLNWDALRKVTALVAAAGNAGNGELTISQADGDTLCRSVQELHDANANKDAEYASLLAENTRVSEHFQAVVTEAKADAKTAADKAEADAKTIADLEAKVAELTPKPKAKKAGAADDGAV